MGEEVMSESGLFHELEILIAIELLFAAYLYTHFYLVTAILFIASLLICIFEMMTRIMRAEMAERAK